MKKSKTSQSAKTANEAGRDRLSRLFLLADEKLKFLEKRQLEGGYDCSAADNEKDAKAMITLTNLYEKLLGMTDRQAAQKEDGASDEAERICVELAERIERLQQEGKDQISSKLEQKTARRASK